MDALSVNNKLFLGYDDTDFLWVNIFKKNKNIDCNTNTLQCVRDHTANPNHTLLTSDNSENCFLSEVCKNKSYATTIKNISNAHSGASGRISDSKSKIYKDVLLCTNFLVSLLFLFYCLKNIIV